MRSLKAIGLGFCCAILVGCSNPAEKEKDPMIEDFMKEFQASMDAFNNRPIYPVLTKEILDTIPDDDLVQVIFDNLSEKLPDDYEREYATVMSWNPSRRAIFMIWLLEAEVNNGGWNQFYYNSSGEYHPHLPEALRLVGANPFADLTERANAVYREENEKITAHHDGSIEGFSKSYEDNPLEPFDDEFYDLNDSLSLAEVQVKYIRMHEGEFLDE